MNSADLLGRGFQTWKPFRLSQESSLLAGLPNEPGVYVLRSPRPFGRYRGSSDIVYIGSTADSKGMKHRIRFYFHPGPTQETNMRIRGKLDLVDDLEIGWKSTADPELARCLEGDLLADYERDHLELPPFNRQTGRKPRLAQRP